MSYRTERINFDSQGDRIVGLLFVPNAPEGISEIGSKADNALPAITVIGPVGFVKEQSPIQYATRLANEGFITLIFDPRYHGESGGEPRRWESGDSKIEDILASVDYLESLSIVDTDQIYGLGICQGVNWMIGASVRDERLQTIALVAGHYLSPQVATMYLGGEEAVQARLAEGREAAALYEESGEVLYMPVVSLSEPGKAHLGAKPAHDWYIGWEDQGHGWHYRGQWENRIAKMSESELWGHSVEPYIQQLTVPTMMLHANRAASGPQVPKTLFEQIPSANKELIWLNDEVQMQFYEDTLTIDKTVQHLDQWYRKVKHNKMSTLKLTGRTFSYEVSGYHIQLTFEEETQLRWEYLAAPEGEELRSDTETIDRTDVSPGIVLMTWTEASGVHVIDVLDLNEMKLHVTFVTADGQRFVTKADVTEVHESNGIQTALQGRTFSYEVTGYHIQLTFETETQLQWEYLAVPEGEELRSDVETIDRTDVRPDVTLMSWTEDSGFKVIDVLDLTEMKLHVTGVTPGGDRFVTQADVTEVL